MIHLKNTIINLKNISYLEIIDNEIYISIRKKIKVEKIKFDLTLQQIETHLNNYGFTKIDNYYINFKKILSIQEYINTTENLEVKSKENIINRFIFDNDYLELEFNIKYWKYFSTHTLPKLLQ